MMCNSDEYGKEIIGDANYETVYQIWHGEKLNRIRSIHARNGFKYLYAKLVFIQENRSFRNCKS